MELLEKKDFTGISSDLVSNFSKAVQALDKNNVEYAIDILKSIILVHPELGQVREKLRIAEKIQSARGSLGKFFDTVKINKLTKAAKIDLLREKYFDAMNKAEEALAINIRSLEAIKILADAANKLGAKFIVLETYELALDYYPENKEILKLLAGEYRLAGKGRLEAKLRQKLVELDPSDLEYKQELRSAIAMASLEENSDSLNYRSRLKDETESNLLEQQEKIIHNIDDVKLIVDELEKQLINEGDTYQVLVNLAWLYYKSDHYPKAFELFKRAELLQEHFDLSMDKAIEQCELFLLDNKNDGMVEDVHGATINISLQHSEKRISVYPNDLQLKYELAHLYWKSGRIDDAIEQFQVSQNHPKWKFLSKVCLGICFYQKKHYELASDQLREAINIENNNPKELLDAVYYLGLSFEKLNDIANAKECFKKVYSVNSKYNDILQKIEFYYGKE